MSCVRISHHNIPQTLEVVSNVFTAPCGRGGRREREGEIDGGGGGGGEGEWEGERGEES